ELYPQDGVTEGGSDWDAAALPTAMSSIVVIRSAKRIATGTRCISGPPFAIDLKRRSGQTHPDEGARPRPPGSCPRPKGRGEVPGRRRTASGPSDARRLRPGRRTAPAGGRYPARGSARLQCAPAG